MALSLKVTGPDCAHQKETQVSFEVEYWVNGGVFYTEQVDNRVWEVSRPRLRSLEKTKQQVSSEVQNTTNEQVGV